MTWMYEDIDLPGLPALVDRVGIEIHLCDENDRPVQGIHTVTGKDVLSPYTFLYDNTLGFWVLNLPPNSEITPVNTHYKRIAHLPNSDYAFLFTVPVADPATVAFTGGSRTSNVATLTGGVTTAWLKGQPVMVSNAGEATYSTATPTPITNIVSTSSFSYANVGSDDPSTSTSNVFKPYRIDQFAVSDLNPIGAPSTALASHIRDIQAHDFPKPLRRWGMDRGNSLGYGVDARLMIFGDSITEGYNVTKREIRWVDALSRRLNGLRMYQRRYFPAAANVGSDPPNTTAQWPGAETPWSTTGSVTSLTTYGADFHAITLASGATATFKYFGDFVNVVYTATVAGPAAAAVTLDGVAQAAIDAQNNPELPGQVTAPYGTQGNYGAHTLVITATGAPMILEGAIVSDGIFYGFGAPFGAVDVFAFGHGGWFTGFFADPANTNWLASTTGICKDPSVVLIALGLNDTLFISATQYGANLRTMISRLDAQFLAAGTTEQRPYVIVLWPGVPDNYADAAWAAANAVGSDRCTVCDIRAFKTGANQWGIFENSGHPNDTGSYWISELIGNFLDRQFIIPEAVMRADGRGPANLAGVSTSAGPRIVAMDTPEWRNNWAQSFANMAGHGTQYDVTVADSAVRERWHKRWFDIGTYECWLGFGEVTTLGATCAVQLGHTVVGTTAATTGTSGNVGRVQVGTTIAVNEPGPKPVCIRKTATNAGPLRFVDLDFRKVS